jgi:hypothetical protein
VRDANPNNLCTTSASITINAPPAPSFSLTKSDPICNGSATGTITATFSGINGPYQLKLDSGTLSVQTSPFTFTGVAAGSHTVTLQDASGCTFTQTISRHEPGCDLTVADADRRDVQRRHRRQGHRDVVERHCAVPGQDRRGLVRARDVADRVHRSRGGLPHR